MINQISQQSLFFPIVKKLRFLYLFQRVYEIFHLFSFPITDKSIFYQTCRCGPFPKCLPLNMFLNSPVFVEISTIIVSFFKNNNNSIQQ